MRRRDDASPDEPASVTTTRTVRHSNYNQSISRRRVLAGAAATASVSLAGCGGRFPNSATTVDATTHRDGNALVWEYPASAVQANGDGDRIGYASIHLEAVDLAWDTDRVMPGLRFTLNSTVGDAGSSERAGGYQADWFRFRIGVPRSYDDTSSFRAFVQPNQWPELRVIYDYVDAVRELEVMAPDVDTDGTIRIEGRFQSSSTTLPRQLHCGFDVQASRSTMLGRTVTAGGRATFDVSTLDRPDEVTLV